MEKLKAHNRELSNIEVTDGNIRSFEKYARKYDIDYCPKKDRSAEPPKYYVFFKAKEVDSITAAFKEYTGWQLKKSKKYLSGRNCIWQWNVWQSTGRGKR